MRILQINTECGIASPGRIASDIHGILRENGHESYIAYGRGQVRGCDTTIRIGNNFDTYIHAVITRLFDKHGYGSYRATKEFVSRVKYIDPDIIHLHNIHGYYLNIEVLFRYLKQVNRPVVWTFHDCWPFTGHCSHFSYVGCNGWKGGCGRCPQIHSYPSSILVDNTAHNFTRKKELFSGIRDMTIVTPSRWLARLVQESFFSECRILVINNGINLNLFKPKKTSYRQRHNLTGKFIILGVASPWSSRKGYDYFTAIAKRLKNDEVIVLVGLKKNQTKNLPQNIIGIARTDSINELAEIYSSADVFVNPTLEDNFPTTNLEALACGTPVITFDTGGSGESIDPDCGVIVKHGDIDELMYSIETVKRRKKSSYSGYARERAVRLYDKNVKYREYLNIYHMISNAMVSTRGVK